MKTCLQKLKEKANVPLQAENPPPQESANAGKISDTLRPERLQRSCTLEEFHDWNEKFNAWFEDNGKVIQKKGLVYARQLLHTVLDSRLVDDLKTNEAVKDDTPVLGRGGCLEVIRDIFLKEFPLHIRRYKFLKCIQEQGQPFDEWWVQKKKMAKNLFSQKS